MRITHPQAPFQGVAPENVFFVANDQQIQLGTGYVIQFFQGEMYPERPCHLFIQLDCQPTARPLMFGALLARAEQLRARTPNLPARLYAQVLPEDGELLRFHVSGIGSMIKGRVSFPAMRNTKQGGLAEVASIIEEIVTGLQTLSVDINVLQGGTVGLNMCLEAATEDDAELIRTLVGAVLVIAKTFVSRSPEMPKEAVDALKSLHIGGLDNKIELRCADVMLILGKSLFPAVLSARRSANTPTMSMKGRNLFLAITQANIEREAAGLAAIWPRTSASDDEDKNDIAGKTYLKSTDYFKDLFDMPNHGKAEWTPYVNCDMDVVGKDFDLWCVAANITDKTPDCIPVLISANFNPELLTLKWDGSLNRKTLLPIGPAHGAVKSPLGDKAITVVRKDGSAQIINANDLTYETLYKGQPFDLTNAETPVIYLTPKGIATPATRR